MQLSTRSGAAPSDRSGDAATLIREAEELIDRFTHTLRTKTIEDESAELVPLASAGPVKQIHGAAAMLAGSVLFDSGLEHYRGSFQNKAMFAPLAASALNLVASTHGMTETRTDSHTGRTITYCFSIGVGALGLGFHAWNVGKRVGGFRWENLFYGAPLGAPGALILSGLAGLAADRLAGNHRKHGAPTLMGMPAGRVVAGFTSLGLVGTIGEAGLLHFRGNFQNPAMYLPVTLPVVAAAVMAEAAAVPSRRSRGTAKFWLGVTSVLGLAGVAFHCYGVSRAMGGWKNWRQNVLDGPPIPAPPSFSGLAIAGLAALTLIEDQPT
jgi:hypothetical protein